MCFMLEILGATLTRLVPAKASVIKQGIWDINLHFGQVSWKTEWKNQEWGEKRILSLELRFPREKNAMIGNILILF